MRKYILMTIAFLMIARMPVLAGNSGQTTIRAVVDNSPRAASEDRNDECRMKNEERRNKTGINSAFCILNSTFPFLRAADWIAAWQAAREACPEASGMTIYYNDRSGPVLESIKVFECVDMQARGELLVITIKQPGQKEESVAIVRASDIVRIGVRKPASAAP